MGSVNDLIRLLIIVVIWAAKIHSIPCVVVTSNSAPVSKLNTVKDYKANIWWSADYRRNHYYGNNLRDSGKRIEMVDPFDDYRVMVGEGKLAIKNVRLVDRTIAIESLESSNLDTLLVAVGGGLYFDIVAAAKKIIKGLFIPQAIKPTGAVSLATLFKYKD
ncbi:hypothetical protein LOAG_01358 [Loa loa]|uniref:Uncharacterized protein n=1 Tax=Loa loa TaxID=7209 RepID=A0A1S0U998_LOALO|nr:hypothetical protein LOAG_01358 [Loa loa]EFO27123.1 hypothetical protein LOAG_01358 [Loa loa]